MLNHEPVAITAAVLAALNVVALVLHLDNELIAALNAAVGPIVALLVRSQVTPVP